jgi:hypothetical protein
MSRASRREWIGLAVIALPCMLYSMDLTVLNLAEFRCGSLVDVSARFDCVVANVEPRVLHALARDVVAALAPGGRLGLSGFLADEAPALRERYGALGLPLSLAGSEDGWCVLAGRAGSNGLVEGTVEGTVDGTADGTVDGAIASLPEER